MKVFIKIVLFLFTVNSYGQLNRELASFNYSISPRGEDEIKFESLNFNLNIPFMLKKGVLVNSISYDFYEISNNNDFYEPDLEKFYRVNYNLSYIYPLQNKWRLSLRGGLGLSSNLVNDLSIDDFQLNGSITAIKRFEKNNKVSRLMFGLGYTRLTGKPQVIPIIRYYKELNSKLSYAIGFPVSFLQYKINNEHEINLSARVNGFYSNLSNSISVQNNNIASGVSFRTGLIGLEYNYKMDKVWSVFFKTEYSFYNNYELVDGNGGQVYDYNMSSAPYFSSGVKLNIINNNKKKRK